MESRLITDHLGGGTEDVSICEDGELVKIANDHHFKHFLIKDGYFRYDPRRR